MIPQPFKTPMLVELMLKGQATAVTDLLHQFGFELHARKHYPFFKLGIRHVV